MNEAENVPGAFDDLGRPFHELRTSGLLWLINRVVFHPRGYSLYLHMHEGETDCTGWGLVGDGTEPWTMGPEIAKEEDRLFALVKELLK